MTAARECGVTRLAEITRLDRLGLPVWQAIRPYGRALSVHQGKGATDLDARIGALCEAVESHAAESAAPDGPHCRFEELPVAARAPYVSDYGYSRRKMAGFDEPISWSRAADLATGRDTFLPHAVVSLDLTVDVPSRFDRSSTGLGAGPDEARAVAVAIRELVERDAQGEWQRAPTIERMAAAVDPDSIRFAWFAEWRARFEAQEIRLSVHALPSVAQTPVIHCTIAGPAEFGGGIRVFAGSSAHWSPESALFRALAEAIQSRLTWIAGSRDDIYPDEYAPAGPRLDPCALPPSPGMRLIDFAAIAPGPERLSDLADRLARQGYPVIAVKRLAPHLRGLAVVKAFVPGLGSLHRRRRTAA